MLLYAVYKKDAHKKPCPFYIYEKESRRFYLNENPTFSLTREEVFTTSKFHVFKRVTEEKSREAVRV